MELEIWIRPTCPACSNLRSVVIEYLQLHPEAEKHIYLFNIEDPNYTEFSKLYDILAIPTLLIVDPNDEIPKTIARSVGVTDLKSLEEFLSGRLVDIGLNTKKSLNGI